MARLATLPRTLCFAQLEKIVLRGRTRGDIKPLLAWSDIMPSVTKEPLAAAQLAAAVLEIFLLLGRTNAAVETDAPTARSVNQVTNSKCRSHAMDIRTRLKGEALE